MFLVVLYYFCIIYLLLYIEIILITNRKEPLHPPIIKNQHNPESYVELFQYNLNEWYFNTSPCFYKITRFMMKILLILFSIANIYDNVYTRTRGLVVKIKEINALFVTVVVVVMLV